MAKAKNNKNNTEDPVNIDLDPVEGETPKEENREPGGDSPSKDQGSDAEGDNPGGEEQKTNGGEGGESSGADDEESDKAPTSTGKKDKAQEKIDELNDRLMRQMAEFENFRRRTEKEKAQMFETGAKSIIEKILPVVDNFERGLAAVPSEGEKDPFKEGMEMVYRQLMTELENLGVKPIEAVGQEFNPEFHNAVMQTQSDEFESGIIAQELQKGYMYRESVVRHSMVAVVE